MTRMMTRRRFAGAAAAVFAMPALVRAAEPLRLGLTPVVLDNGGEILAHLQAAFSRGLDRPIDLLQRRTMLSPRTSPPSGSTLQTEAKPSFCVDRSCRRDDDGN